ncbi:MAG: LysM peptidoglycan-binding domain-containing M23 family metallopeptidase [Synergistota bacterium]|nr:LysM peptidoglycan-binding domain-containing M23 family metallopeptidase [Synergistota bacterium]
MYRFRLLTVFMVFLLCGLCPTLSSTAELPWTTHKVEPGESIDSLSLEFGLSPGTILLANEIRSEAGVSTGDTLYIPRDENSVLETMAEVRARKQGKSTSERYTQPDEGIPVPAAKPAQQRQVETDSLIWPVDGVLYSPFGWRHGRFHTGIDISAPSGTPIKAARGGVVVRTGWRRGYGRVLLLDHGDGMFTRYAHCLKILVKEGQRVGKGQKIALLGRSGRATGNHLHFEVVTGGKHRNPVNYLPKRTN